MDEVSESVPTTVQPLVKDDSVQDTTFKVEPIDEVDIITTTVQPELEIVSEKLTQKPIINEETTIKPFEDTITTTFKSETSTTTTSTVSSN